MFWGIPEGAGPAGPAVLNLYTLLPKFILHIIATADNFPKIIYTPILSIDYALILRIKYNKHTL